MGYTLKSVPLTDIDEMIARLLLLTRLGLAQLQGESGFGLKRLIDRPLWRDARANRGQALRRMHHRERGIGLESQECAGEGEIQDLTVSLLEEQVAESPALHDGEVVR